MTPLPNKDQQDYEDATHCTGSTDCPRCSPKVADLKRILVVDEFGNPITLPEHKATGEEVPEIFSDAYWDKATPLERIVNCVALVLGICAAAVLMIGLAILALSNYTWTGGWL